MDTVKEDLLNILYIARYLASADKEYDPAERQAFQKIVGALGISPGELKETLSQNKPIQLAIKQLHNPEAAQLLTDILLVIASADGKLDSQEKKFLSKVMGQLGIDTSKHPFFQEGEVKEVASIAENMDNFVKIIQQKAAALK